MSIALPQLKRNNKVLNTEERETMMGKSKGWKYIAPVVYVYKKNEKGEDEVDLPATAKNLSENVIPWIGEEQMASILDRWLALQGQDASEVMKKDPEANPLDGNIKDGGMKIYTDGMETLSLRGGETIEDLEERLEKLRTSNEKLAERLVNEGKNPMVLATIVTEINKNNQEIKNVKGAIELRRRPGRGGRKVDSAPAVTAATVAAK